MSLAQSSTSWTSMAMGDSGSHRHAALWVLFAAWPKGAEGWLYCVPGIRVSFCVRDKALLCRKQPAPFLFFFFCSFSRSSARCNTRVNEWTSGWKCRQGDKCIAVCWSILNERCAAQCWQRKKNHWPIAISFLLNIAVEIWAEIQHNSFSFSAFERCSENARVLSLSEMNDFHSRKHIVYRPRILHNIKYLT